MSGRAALQSDEQGSGALGFILALAGWRRLAMLAVLMTAVALTEGFGLLMLVPLAQSVVGGGDAWLGEWMPRLPLAFLLAIFVALVAARSLLGFFNQNLQRDIGIDSIRRLRGAMRDAVTNAEWRWLAAQSGADHAALIMGMSEKIGYMAIQVLQLAAACITLALLLGTALILSWQLTALVLLLGGLVVIPVTLLRMRPVRDGEAFTAAYSRLQRVLQQGIAHLRAARIAGAGPAVRQEFDDLAREVGRIEKAYGRKVIFANLLFQVLAAAGLAFVVWLGIQRFGTPLAILLPVLAIFARAVPLSNTVQQGIRGWQFARPTIEEMQRLLAGARAAAEPDAGPGDEARLREEMLLRDVRVSYDTRGLPIFDQFYLSIPAGSIVAVTGSSGSGKSTLADLVSGLLVPDAGDILLDGKPLTASSRIAWRRNVAYVEQSPYLFDDTIRSNLEWGQDGIPMEALEQALDAASADFVFDLPEGIDTVVGETGRQLSGGERQRIALARALLQRPDLLILDEATSSLDSESEAMIVSSIRKLRGTCTVLVLGHRSAMSALADKVVALDSRAG